MSDKRNIDHKTVDRFGEECAAFDQTDLPLGEQCRISKYLSVDRSVDLAANPKGCVADVAFRESMPDFAPAMREV